MRLRFPSSVRLNLVLVVLAGVLPVSIVILTSGWEMREKAIRDSERTCLRLADYYAYRQDNEVDRIRKVLANLGAEEPVQAMDIPACNELFKTFLAANPNYVNFALIATDGEALASALPFKKQNLSNRVEIIRALSTGAFAIGEYSIGRVSKVQILPVAYPVRDPSGRIICILIASLRLHDYANIFEQAKLPPGSFVGLVDYKGTRLYYYPPKETNPIGGKVASGSWEKLQSIGRRGLFTSTGSDGVQRVFAVRRLMSETGQAPYLNIIVGIPEDRVLAEPDAHTRKYALWVALSLAFSTLFALLVGKYGIHKRVARLVTVAQRLGTGDLAARSGLTEAGGSLGRLTRALDDMAAALERDAEKRQRAEEALRSSRNRYQRLVDNTTDAIYLADREGSILDVNTAACNSLGWSRDELLGFKIWDIDPIQEIEGYRAQWEGVADDVPILFETIHVRKDGSRFPVEVNAVSFSDGGKRFTYGLARDITARKQAEEELLKAKEAAESSSQAKSVFLANMSHEIRTPLNGIMGMLQLMGKTPLDAEQGNYVIMAVQACRRLTGLMGDILDMSRIESGHMEIRNEAFDLNDTLRGVDQIFRPAANQAGVQLRFRVEPAGPGILMGDPARLQQVLNNLVGNAVKFTPRGSVEVAAILLAHGKTGEQNVLFTISDTGIGIPDSTLENLFEPFTQAEGSFMRQYQGAGLGLSIVKRLVKAMGGSICVESLKDEGTCFFVSIPFKIADSAIVAPGPMDSPLAPLSRPGCRVLVAEDDIMNAMVLAKLLQLAECSVHVAGDGEQALAALRDEDFDIVLMDIQMPVMDGVEATKSIRNGSAGKDKADIPIIALTAYAMDKERREFLEAGMDGCLSKPVEIAALIQAMEDTLPPVAQT